MDVPWWNRSRRADQRVLVDLVNFWLQIGGIQPRFRWGADAPVVFLGTPCLIGARAVQLLLAISRTDGLAICSACALPYIPTKQRAPNRRRYCPTCRAAGLPLRDAQRAHRTRVRTDEGAR